MTTKLTDVIVPEVFTPYIRQETETKSRLIRSGVVTRSELLDRLLSAEGGNTFTIPSWQDLSGDSGVGSDDDSTSATPGKISTSAEIAVRLFRTRGWSSMNLVQELAGDDPMGAIAARVVAYWERERQKSLVATLVGVFADNAAAPAGSEHVQNDMINDIKGASFIDGVTNFNTRAFIDTALTAGDSMEDFVAVMCHSVVYASMQKNNLIDFIPDSEGRVNIPTFLGREVIVDDGVPNPAGAGAAATASGIYHTWLIGRGALQMGMGEAPRAVETDSKPEAGNGAGQDFLWTRQVWAIHPTGNKFAAAASGGGPSNAATPTNLAHPGSWQRVYPERKQIKLAQLVTRES